MSSHDAVRQAKQAVRERVWRLLEEQHVSRFPGARGRIPNFAGAEAAAARLASLPHWKAARVMKANPDAPQLPARARALAEGRLLYMAVPRLVAEQPFIALHPARMKVPPRRAASIRRASTAGLAVSVEEMEPVELVLCGTVAVNREGVRVGKGGGYSDLEFGLLAGAGLLAPDAVLVTTVHPLQVLEEVLPETEHDFRVDLIVTAEEVIVTGGGRRPPGILWDHLDDAKLAAIPVLSRLAGRAARRGLSAEPAG